MKLYKGLELLEFITGLAGFVLIWNFDWRLALGAFLLLWSEELKSMRKK